jgi:hypothetical protein
MAYRTDVEAEGTIPGTHVCRSCGGKTLARVRARNIATTERHYGAPSAGSLRVARAEATAGLVRDARDSLAIVHCPKCGRRDVGAMMRPLLKLAGLAALAFGLIGGAGTFFVLGALGIGVVGDRMQLDEVWAPILGWALFFAALAASAFVAGRIRRADESVDFEEIAERPRRKKRVKR